MSYPYPLVIFGTGTLVVLPLLVMMYQSGDAPKSVVGAAGVRTVVTASSSSKKGKERRIGDGDGAKDNTVRVMDDEEGGEEGGRGRSRELPDTTSGEQQDPSHSPPVHPSQGGPPTGNQAVQPVGPRIGFVQPVGPPGGPHIGFVQPGSQGGPPGGPPGGSSTTCTSTSDEFINNINKSIVAISIRQDEFNSKLNPVWFIGLFKNVKKLKVEHDNNGNMYCKYEWNTDDTAFQDNFDDYVKRLPRTKVLYIALSFDNLTTFAFPPTVPKDVYLMCLYETLTKPENIRTICNFDENKSKGLYFSLFESYVKILIYTVRQVSDMYRTVMEYSGVKSQGENDLIKKAEDAYTQMTSFQSETTTETDPNAAFACCHSGLVFARRLMLFLVNLTSAHQPNEADNIINHRTLILNNTYNYLNYMYTTIFLS